MLAVNDIARACSRLQKFMESGLLRGSILGELSGIEFMQHAVAAVMKFEFLRQQLSW